ncbi:MAG: adenosylmethionine--8-amino-7-oxononanoate transaminase [Myxococcota bacterium]|nr:adenosylmethionine--8-amino-7-oxononanoate transaminase [Myxococcota bacterium]MDW8362085.1 adenosylmethionine--8-amino-7-oxononanoate transaminase [Myxococcales bacterium]
MSLDAAALVALDRAHLWRPYTSHEDHRNRPLLVVRAAEGCWLIGDDGRRYLDGNASWWVSALGHRHPRLVRAMRDQLDRLDHCALAGLTHEGAVRLAAELCSTAPAGLTRVFYSDDGSTAVEVALKIAVQSFAQNGEPERRRIVALAGAYHGDTAGAVSVGGIETFRRPYGPLLFEALRPPDPEHGEQGWERAVAWIEDELARSGASIAAVLVEPVVQGAAGMRIWPPRLLVRLREATRRAGSLLIADEVFTGFGRTGPMWACEHAGITPDLLCTAKALGGGMIPFAATLATETLYARFEGGLDRALFHGHSYCGNPIGCALALETLAVLREERVLEHARTKAARLAAGFDRLRRLPAVRRTRAIGMVAAADLGDGGYRGRLGWTVYERALERGAYLRPLGDTIYVAPALNISEPDLERLISIVHDAVGTL